MFQFSVLANISVLSYFIRLAIFPSPRNISDEEWIPILEKENALLSAIIKTNESQQTHQLKERAAERIACEIEGYGIAMQRDRKILDGLLADLSRLRWGKLTNEKYGQLPSAIGALPDEIQWTYGSGVSGSNRIAVARFQGAYDDNDALTSSMSHAENAVLETAN